MSEQVREQPAPRTVFARLAGVIVSPGDTFEEIARHPGWVAPFIIYLVVFCIGFGVYAAKADWVTIVTDRFENNPIVKMMPDVTRDKALADATADYRKLTTPLVVIKSLIEGAAGQIGVYHFAALIYASLFVMMGALKDLKLGRSWGNFLLCLLTLVGFTAVYSVSSIAFSDSPGSKMLLTGTAAILMVAGWIWLLNGHTQRDAEFNRMMSVCAYGSAVMMLSLVALMVASLAHQGPIQVYFDKLVPSSLGAILKPDNAAARALLSSLDIFWIWFLVVLTIGFRAVTKLSLGMAASMAFLPWALIVMVRVAWAAVFG